MRPRKKGFKPDWSDISAMKEGMKYYWERWDSLELRDEALQYKFVNNRGSSSWLTVIPSMPKGVILKQLHDGVTGGGVKE